MYLGFTKESFSDRLKKLREEQGLTQVDLADKLGVTSATIQNWEREKCKVLPNMINIMQLCEILKCSADYLLFGNAPSIVSSRMLSEHIGLSLKAAAKLNLKADSYLKKANRKLSSEDRKVLSAIVESDSLLRLISNYLAISTETMQIGAILNGQTRLLEDCSFISVNGKAVKLIDIAKERQLKKISDELDRIKESL